MFTMLYLKWFVLLGHGARSWETGTGTKDKGTVEAIPFGFILIRFLFGLWGWAHPGGRITVPKFTWVLFNLCTDSVVEQYSSRINIYE